MVIKRLLAATGLLLSVVVAMPSAAQANGSANLDAIGNPTWKPVDCHVFAAPIGTAETGYAEAFETVQGLLPPPNHTPQIEIGLAIGPGPLISRHMTRS